MNNLRVNTNRNNTIIEVSGDDISDLKGGEIVVESNYDFPTSQPIIFYRWNDVDELVEVNSKEAINSFNEETGLLTGLDLEPHIERVLNSEFVPNTTKTITIEGINFSPFSLVEISGDMNFVNTTFFESPKLIKVEVTVGENDGLFNLVVKNDLLHSKDSGYNKVIVKSKTIIDLRTYPIDLLNLDMTDDITVTQDATKGLEFKSNRNSWNRGVKFGGFTWDRSDDITFEIVFTRTTDTLFMVGIGSNNLDVSYINSAYYKQEIGMYHNNNLTNTMYGGGDVTNWSQGIGANVIYDKNEFYKIRFDFSGNDGYECCISQVNPDDWDEEVFIHCWVSNCPADDIILTPFIIPQAANGGYHITGFRY